MRVASMGDAFALPRALDCTAMEREFSLLFAATLALACSSESNSNTGTSSVTPYPPPAPDDCITDVTPGHQTLTCEGLSFELNVPDVCLEQACGFITDVHGFGMNGELENTHSKLRELGGAAGYIVVNPSAPGALLSSSWSPSNDAAVFAIMQRVISVWHVDPKRIHFAGYSMGGWMTWRFICNHADMIASAAPLAAGSGSGNQSCAFSGDQIPAREVPIFHVHGRTDGLVPFATSIAQRDAVIAAWQLNSSEVVGSGPDYDWTRYTNTKKTAYEFAQHDWECSFVLGSTALKGHCFPGSDQFLGCGATNAFNWGETVLKFFQDHPMK